MGKSKKKAVSTTPAATPTTQTGATNPAAAQPVIADSGLEPASATATSPAAHPGFERLTALLESQDVDILVAFLNAISSTREGKYFKQIWDHGLEEGKAQGSQHNEQRFEEGRREGFDEGWNAGRSYSSEDWSNEDYEEGYSARLEEGQRQVLTTVYIDVEVQAVPMEFTPATITHDFGTQTVTLSSATPHYFDAQAQTLPTVGMCHFGTQTSPPPEIIHIPCTVNTDMPPPAVNANPTILYTSQHVINNSSDSLDWADNTAANIPIYPVSPTRDWSALWPTSTQPFSTLQR
ncbi:hypothetical protein H0H81_003490 [Sphagnurus paluster]|uniref:Uncharacterized protein n=1 Tax=Sphagnurus paluster TaxID=117069 RepID=A0A9P7GHQ6_9AGAR|nr:hypothetical protein H0H81_003490 [Sphagnurus paluster]